MTPKEKAIKLVNEFSSLGLQQRSEGIVCALKTVNIILSLHKKNWEIKNMYWEKVKKEIEKL